jgi:hypothetical protein
MEKKDKNALVELNDYVTKNKFQAHYMYEMHTTSSMVVMYSCVIRIGISMTDKHYGQSKKEAKMKASENMLQLVAKSPPLVRLINNLDTFALWAGIDQYVTLQYNDEVRTVCVTSTPDV